MTTKTHKGRLDALAVEVAEVLKLDRNHELSVLNGTLVIIQRAGYKNYSLDRLRSIIFSPTGRNLMEQEAEKRGYENFYYEKTVSEGWSVTMNKPSDLTGEHNISSEHKTKEVACALTLYELVNGQKFELEE